MSSRFLNELTAKDAHIATLYMIVVFLMLITMGLWYGWQTAPQNLRIFIPPDLRAGAITRPDEYQAAQVFAFATMYTQSLNRWEEDGQQDYPARIQDLQAYMTQTFRDQQIRTMNEKMSRGELAKRTRYSSVDTRYTDYQPEFVTALRDGSWNVEMVLQVVEKVGEVEAKRIKIKYPINVVRISIDPEKNIWGLALNGTSPGYKEEIFEDEQ